MSAAAERVAAHRVGLQQQMLDWVVVAPSCPGLHSGLQPGEGSAAAGRTASEAAHSHRCSCRGRLPFGPLEWPRDAWASDARQPGGGDVRDA